MWVLEPSDRTELPALGVDVCLRKGYVPRRVAQTGMPEQALERELMPTCFEVHYRERVAESMWNTLYARAGEFRRPRQPADDLQQAVPGRPFARGAPVLGDEQRLVRRDGALVHEVEEGAQLGKAARLEDATVEVPAEPP